MSAWIQTYRGRFTPLEPRAEDVRIEDIAHQLALTNRFRGATRDPYSVAQHCVLVAEHLPKRLKLAGLMHDAPEAYLGDVSAPVKGRMMVRNAEVGTRSFIYVETVTMQVIAQALGFDWTSCYGHAVRKQDLRACATERRDLLAHRTRGWGLPRPWRYQICAWHWEYAESRFLEMFHQLMNKGG